MKTFIALFRGINVGGNNKLPMKELIAVLDGLGLEDIRTYIQSGNVVFRGKPVDSKNLAAKISAAIGKSHGFEPRVLLLDATKLENIIKKNPFPEAEFAGNTLHVNFLAEPPPAPNFDGIEKIRAASERYVLNGDVFYLHAPDGIGRSRLATNMERLLGVTMTGRNWNTVCKLEELTKVI
jgi:uncharacterized protein (DUF1697 family)